MTGYFRLHFTLVKPSVAAYIISLFCRQYFQFCHAFGLTKGTKQARHVPVIQSQAMNTLDSTPRLVGDTTAIRVFIPLVDKALTDAHLK